MLKRAVNITSGIITMSIVSALAGITIMMLPEPHVDPVEQECIAKNIYYEARSEPIEGQIAVAHVTMNRVRADYWPNTPCEVVYQPKQFSWTFLVKNQNPSDAKAYEQAMTIARDVLIGNTDDPTYGATFYHANYVNPSWAKQMTVSKVIGHHIFYTWDGTWD